MRFLGRFATNAPDRLPRRCGERFISERGKAPMLSLSRRLILSAALSASLGVDAVHAFEFASAGRRRGRVTAPVFIDGQGPYAFAIDTAANCSVVAEDLAESLGLRESERLMMHTLVGSEEVSAVTAPRISSGSLDRGPVRLALGKRAAIEGLDGLLGSDLLADRRLVLNFRGGGRAQIGRSRTNQRGFLDPVDPSTRLIAVADERFNGLLMVPSHVGSARAVAIVDSGATATILNRAAAEAGGARPWRLRTGERVSRIQSPSGRTAPAEVMILPAFRLAGSTVLNMPVLVGDFHTFALWGVADRPAVLLGVDVLGLFQSVTIDLRRREFSLRV